MKSTITIIIIFIFISCKSQTKNLNEIIKVHTEEPQWTLYNPPKNGQNIRLSIPITSINCVDTNFPDAITGIRFNVIIKDAFNEILYTANDMTIEFGVGNLLGYYDNGFTYELKRVNKQSILIGSNTSKNEKIKSLYSYSQNYSIKVYCDISAIVLKNGNVLK